MCHWSLHFHQILALVPSLFFVWHWSLHFVKILVLVPALWKNIGIGPNHFMPRGTNTNIFPKCGDQYQYFYKVQGPMSNKKKCRDQCQYFYKVQGPMPNKKKCRDQCQNLLKVQGPITHLNLLLILN